MAVGKRKWHWKYVLRDTNLTTGRKYWDRIKVYDDEISQPPEVPERGLPMGKETFVPPTFIARVAEEDDKKRDSKPEGE
jgi:hypothetical protein